jgi:hypothetical protein
MSEFKFACPVCGQHITADSHSSGSELDCPTCFRRIVVPQAPSGDSKLILSAVQSSKGRPKSPVGGDLTPLRRSRPGLPLAGAALLLVLIGAGAAAYHFWPQLSVLFKRIASSSGSEPAETPASLLAATSAAPANIHWTLDLSQAVIPEERATGCIRGQRFSCEQASLTGGALTLRQGEGWPPDLALAVLFYANKGEDLSGKTFKIPPDRTPPVPRVILRWKDKQQEAQKEDITSGYALQVMFGNAATGRITGKIFIALPDEAKSVVAGSFDAEIKRPRTSP